MTVKFEQSVEAFCVGLVEQKRVLLLPGNYFNFGTRHFRLSFGYCSMPGYLAKVEEYLHETGLANC